MKKILALLLVLLMVFSFSVTAFAETTEPETETDTEVENGTETEPVAQTPIYTLDVSNKDWTYTNHVYNVYDNTILESSMSPYYVVPQTGYVVSNSRYEAVFSYDADDFEDADYISPTNMAAWLKSEGQLRFYVKLPWQEGTPDLSYHFGIGYYVSYTTVTENEDGTVSEKTSKAYPETHATVSVPADGLWHEIRLSTSDFSSKTVFDVYAADPEHTTVIGFYGLRVRAANVASIIKSADEIFFSTFAEYYSEPITAEVNDGNIEQEVYLLDTNDTGTTTGLTFSNEKITDNKFYRTARKITRTGDMDTKDIYPFKVKPTGIEMDGFVENHGDMRTYMKNDSDSDITFNIGIKGSVVNSTYGTGTQYPAATKSVTIPANSGWVEIRISYDDLKLDAKKIAQFTESETYYWFYLVIAKSSTLLADVGDAIWVTPLEIYNRSLVEDVNTDFEREYKQITIKNTAGATWKQDSQGYITRTEGKAVDLPFAGSVATYTATETFDIDSYTAKQVGFTGGTVNCADIAEWAVHNPNAEMRMWVKSAKDITLVFEVLTYDSTAGSYRTMKITLDVTGSPDWQEVRLTRADVVGASTWAENVFNEIFTTETNTTASMNIFLSDITAGMQAGDSFQLAQRIEFFSHEAYDKGDINRDGKVNVLDLIRTKKYIANGETAFINADIDSNNKLEAADLTYLRKWMLNGAWN